jgi:hypothetical protein
LRLFIEKSGNEFPGKKLPNHLILLGNCEVLPKKLWEIVLMKTINRIFLLVLMAAFASCSLLPKRDYMDEMVYYQDPMFMPGEDFETVPGDSGRAYRDMNELMKRTPATVEYDEEMRYRSSLKKEMYVLESHLTDIEFEEYEQVKHKLSSDSERIYYLRLGNRSDRQDYLRSKGVISSPIHTINEMRMANYSDDILVGMPKNNVISSYGQPDRVMSSGDVYSRTEQWIYYRPDGNHVIQFYRDRVQGWSIE